MGLLELHATLNPAQFWPHGTADADTIKVGVAEARGGFIYDGRPTRAFAGARIANKPVISGRAQVTVRLQGIDAPELHYRPTFLRRSRDEQSRIASWNRAFRQPLGEAAASALGTLVASLGGGEIECTVRTRVGRPGDTFDMYGRFIGDVFVRIGHSEINLNHWLAQNGWAFPAFYNSMRADEITAVQSLCQEAQSAERGVWARPQPDLRAFAFRRIFRKTESSAPPRDAGPVSFPKLFRRIAAWRVLGAAALPAGAFLPFLRSKADVCYETQAFLKGAQPTRRSLDAFVTKTGKLSVAPEDLVFQEAASSLRNSRGEVVDKW